MTFIFNMLLALFIIFWHFINSLNPSGVTIKVCSFKNATTRLFLNIFQFDFSHIKEDITKLFVYYSFGMYERFYSKSPTVSKKSWVSVPTQNHYSLISLIWRCRISVKFYNENSAKLSISATRIRKFNRVLHHAILLDTNIFPS